MEVDRDGVEQSGWVATSAISISTVLIEKETRAGGGHFCYLYVLSIAVSISLYICLVVVKKCRKWMEIGRSRVALAPMQRETRAASK